MAGFNFPLTHLLTSDREDFTLRPIEKREENQEREEVVHVAGNARPADLANTAMIFVVRGHDRLAGAVFRARRDPPKGKEIEMLSRLKTAIRALMRKSEIERELDEELRN